MFINLTNHPSAYWSEEQRNAAELYGEIIDIPFPLVNENATEAEIKQLAEKYLDIILSRGEGQDMIVHVMGEQTFCYALISNLQKEGIRCIASCTEHDTFFNEEGQKVSTFHFTRFREYVPSRTLGWWKNMKNHLNIFTTITTYKGKQYSWSAFFLLLLAEIATIFFHHTKLSCLLWLAIISACIILFLYFFSKLSHLTFKIRNTIVSKLLANAISPTPIGTSYLLAFVIHIGWLTNIVLGLYTTENNDFCNVLFSSLVCVIGLITLIVFFPDAQKTKDVGCEQVFISGISSINVKPEIWPKKYEGLNIIPLVRILQLLNDDGRKSRMVILLSDAFKDDESTFATLKHIITLVNPKATDEMECQNTVQDKLKLLIRETAKREFPNKTKQINSMEIEFTTPCSYFENFEIAFGILESKSKELDNAQHQLYFNLTPGTGIIGSLMTLMSIDGDRELYYYSQEKMPNDLTITEEENEKFKMKLLKPVDKSKVPLQALLSQALESIK